MYMIEESFLFPILTTSTISIFILWVIRKIVVVIEEKDSKIDNFEITTESCI